MSARPTKPDRDSTYDVLRGLAILTMLCANVVGYVTPAAEHPLWLRIYGSFAAPLFITLAGLVASLGIRSKGYGFVYFLKRGLLIIGTAALVIDVAIWRILPFTTYYVLYLIGYGFIVLFFFEKLRLPGKIAVIVLVIAATPLLQRYLGYADLPSEYDLRGRLTSQSLHKTTIWQHWLVDGWFPVFPWIAFAFLGGVMLEIKERFGSYRDWRVLGTSLIALVGGGAVFWKYSFAGLLVERGQYSEVFYPPTPAYVVVAIGVIGVLAAAVEGGAGGAVYFPVRLLGRASMFIYILHTALVEIVILPHFTDPKTEQLTGTLSEALVVYGLVTLVCFLVALALHFAKRRWKMRNFFLRFYLGS